MIEIKPLKWDSHFFHKKIGAVSHNVSYRSSDLLDIMSREKYDLLYIFSDEEKLDQDLISSGANLADRKVTYSKQVSHSNLKPLGVIRYQGDSCDDLTQLAFQSGYKSRFKLDPILSERFEDMYRLWIENSLNGTFADELFVIKEFDLINGFVTVKKNDGVGVIGLIAVSDKQRGRGFGTLLIDKVNEWCAKNELNTIEVATQLDNEGACKFYKSKGFSIKRIQYIYHLWK